MGPASPILRWTLLTLVLVAALTGPVLAQSSYATLHGTVTDSDGGVPPGVSVKLRAPATGLPRDVVANSSGVYVFNFLPADEYEITAQFTGFKSPRRADSTLEIGQNPA